MIGGLFAIAAMAARDLLAGRPLYLRSAKWPAVRAAHLRREPRCQWCGGTAALEVHHMKPFHLDPADELNEANLITLCEVRGLSCHLCHGHLDDWKRYNPHVRWDCGHLGFAARAARKTA